MIIIKPGIFYYAESDAPAECLSECESPIFRTTELQDTCLMSFSCEDGTFGAMQFNSVEPMLKLSQKFTDLLSNKHKLDSLVLYYTKSSAKLRAVITAYLEYVFELHPEFATQKQYILVETNEMIAIDKSSAKKGISKPTQMIFSQTTTTTTALPVTRLQEAPPNRKKMKDALSLN